MSYKEGEYSKITKLGEGSYGKVFLVKSRDGNDYALKRLKTTSEEGVPFTSIREIKILKELKEVFKEKEYIYLVLEFMVYDLSDLLKQYFPRLTLNDKKFIFKQLLEGLDVMHRSWIMHRDIKPSNLLIDEQGNVKLSDFGLARYFGSPNTLLTKYVVTRYYRPPEVIFGSQSYGPSIDIWSSGCILCEIFSGKPLFQGQTDIDQLSRIFSVCGSANEKTWKGCSELPNYIEFEDTKPLNISDIIPGIPNDAAELIMQMLQLDPKKRITAKEALESEFLKDIDEKCSNLKNLMKEISLEKLKKLGALNK